MMEVHAGAVVLAMGCRERSRGAIAIPGTRPAGVMTAGQAQRYINIEGLMPGREVVILGSGDIGMIMARRLQWEGARVRAVVEMSECVGGLTRNLVQCLQDHAIPLYLRHTVTDICGSEHLEAVEVTPLGPDGEVDARRAFRIECDLLLLSVGLIPENEVSRAAGVEMDAATGGPVVDQDYATSLPGVFAAGNAVQVFDLVDHVSACAARAGSAAARFARGEHPSTTAMASIVPGTGIRALAPQRVATDYASDAPRFFLRASEVKRSVELRLETPEGEKVATWSRSVVRPAEMICLELGVPLEALRRYRLTMEERGNGDGEQ
jgi:NADPH-dependent 2,4-dienoyl-CoA reductase/sulfur reductase-like enzyme